MKLYNYWRSSAAYRVRIALGLKGIEVETVPIDLLKDEQRGEAYRRENPQGLVPALADAGDPIPQSLAILEYLEERFPEPSLLPVDAAGRARVRGLALAVACEIHPLQNLRVLRYLKRSLGLEQDAIDTWYRHWVTEGFTVIERSLAGHPSTGACCHGDTPTFADACLVPQLYNARRVQVDLTPFPTIVRIEQYCLRLPAFDRARPENQPGAGTA